MNAKIKILLRKLLLTIICEFNLSFQATFYFEFIFYWTWFYECPTEKNIMQFFLLFGLFISSFVIFTSFVDWFPICQIVIISENRTILHHMYWLLEVSCSFWKSKHTFSIGTNLLRKNFQLTFTLHLFCCIWNWLIVIYEVYDKTQKSQFVWHQEITLRSSERRK